jgi:hypothetical protein
MPEFTYVWIGLGIVALAAITLLANTFFMVQQRTAAIVQRFGKFVREAGPGLNIKIPFIDSVVARINLRVQQLDVKIETKTEDNVFVQMVVAVQFYVLPEKAYDAYYKLDDARRQITSYVSTWSGPKSPKSSSMTSSRRRTRSPTSSNPNSNRSWKVLATGFSKRWSPTSTRMPR